MTLAEKQQTLRAMLTHYRDAVETLQRGDYGGKIQFTSRYFQMPNVWHRCGYPELYLRLLELRKDSLCVYKHVINRYIVVENARRTIMFRNGKMVGLGDNEEIIPPFGIGDTGWTEEKKRMQPNGTIREVVIARWPSWVNLGHVDIGVERIARRYKGYLAAPTPDLFSERKEAA